jgi:hypothetical protein
MQSLAQMNLDAREPSAIAGQQSGKHRICQRNHTGDDDLSARPVSRLPHALDADLEVVEQTLCKTDELLSGLCNTHLPGIAGK